MYRTLAIVDKQYQVKVEKKLTFGASALRRSVGRICVFSIIAQVIIEMRAL